MGFVACGTALVPRQVGINIETARRRSAMADRTPRRFAQIQEQSWLTGLTVRFIASPRQEPTW
jgi:hypothetical protein